MTQKKEKKQEKKEEANQQPADDRPLMLSGCLQPSDCPKSGLRLNSIPAYYNVISVASAVLVNHALLEFEYCSRIINRPMLREVHAEKKTTVLLSVGGKGGNINHLNQPAKVSNFYNSLAGLYQDWGFDGVHFELHQVEVDNLPYIIKTIRWFRESFPKAVISIGVEALDVSPAAPGINGKWNRLVPLLNELKDIINRVQIRTFGYGNTSGKLNRDRHLLPQGDASARLAYIFRSFVEPFRFDSINTESETGGVTGYDGMAPGKVVLEVQPLATPGQGHYPADYISPLQLRQVIKELEGQYHTETGGIMISSIIEDAGNDYRYSSQCRDGGEALETAPTALKETLPLESTTVSPVFRMNLMSKLREKFPQEIVTQRLRLRPFALDDGEELQTLAGDSAVSGTTVNIPYPWDSRMVRQWLVNQKAQQEEGNSLYFALDLKNPRRLIGSVGLVFNHEHHRAEMEFWIGKDYWNKGYCSEAASAVLDYGFKKLNLNRIFAMHFKNNLAAGRVLEKIGMEYEGCMLKHFKTGSTFEDAFIWGILKENYKLR